MTRLALFDLDHTLIPFDSGMAWTRHLIAQGALDAQAETRYLAFCHQYVEGTLDIHAMHRSVIAPMARFEPAQLQRWRDSFALALRSRFSPALRARVEQHRASGDLCAIVTATSRLVAEPFAQALAIEHLVATEPVWVNGRPSGEIDGLPCFREHKVARVNGWLASQALPPLGHGGDSWFYSDSISDLALLQCVNNPVAVRPDPALREQCLARGWAIIEET
ncbi:MAG: HAD-IB family hydrolase [Burkholderiaceae bacterium]|nr:MAG: HAD-IB family hydrolase [Burkholderiaceae bacterium]